MFSKLTVFLPKPVRTVGFHPTQGKLYKLRPFSVHTIKGPLGTPYVRKTFLEVTVIHSVPLRENHFLFYWRKPGEVKTHRGKGK